MRPAARAWIRRLAGPPSVHIKPICFEQSGRGLMLGHQGNPVTVAMRKRQVFGLQSLCSVYRERLCSRHPGYCGSRSIVTVSIRFPDDTEKVRAEMLWRTAAWVFPVPRRSVAKLDILMGP